MEKRFVKEGHIFTTFEKKNGKVVLSYCGKEDGIPQGFIWVCSNKEEATDMIDAVIDPERYPDDEWYARHENEIHANCKW